MTEIEETIKSLKEMFPKGLCEVNEYKMAQVAINALEKQIAKKPIERISLLGLDKGGKCPTCNKHINTCRYWMYCECGQKIDWSDTN